MKLDPITNLHRFLVARDRRNLVRVLILPVMMLCVAVAVAGAAGAAEEAIGWDLSGEASGPGWSPVFRLAGGMLGVTTLPESEASALGIEWLAPLRSDGLYLLAPAPDLRDLDHGRLPPAWRVRLGGELTTGEEEQLVAAVVPIMRGEHLTLLSLPEALRGVWEAPPSRSAAFRAGGVREFGLQDATPIPAQDRPSQERNPTYWSSLQQAVQTDRMFGDLDYLSSTLQTRYTTTPQMELATEFVFNLMSDLGLDTSYDEFFFSGNSQRNVVGIQYGTVDPSRVYIVCGHLDSTSPDPLTLAPGAEDNGSGSAAVLEAARLLSGIETAYTIYYICFAAEEVGLVGSAHFAAGAAQAGLDIRGVLNVDMVGYYHPAGDDLWVEGFYNGVSSEWLMDLLRDNALDYTDLSVYKYTGEGFGSDHVPFHNEGYPAVLAIEYDWSDYPCYHRTCDAVDQLDADLWGKITAATIITAAQLAEPQGGLGILDGTVILSGGGNPAGSQLELVGTGYSIQSSDGSGAFSFGDLFPGTYLLRATRAGYDPGETAVVIEADQTTQVQITLEPLQPGSISGTVRAPDGMPIAGALIEIEAHTIVLTSGPDGTYSFPSIWPGDLNLSAASVGRIPRGIALTLGQGEVLTDVDFVLATLWDFESVDEGLQASGSWEWGADSQFGAHSGSLVWGTALNGEHGNCADDQLVFPAVSLGAFLDASFSAYFNYDIEDGYDGANLKVSFDGGQNWSVVTPTEGYDGTVSGTCNPLDGQTAFMDVSGSWIQRHFDLSPFVGQWVRLRFDFGSDVGLTRPGIYVDDVAIAGTMIPADAELPPDPALSKGPALRLAPNPARPGTRIELRLPTSQRGTLTVVGLDGRALHHIRESVLLAAGRHPFDWNGDDDSGRPLPAGVYWVRWTPQTPSPSVGQRLLLLR